MPTKRGREISKLLAIRDREGLTYDELSARTGLAATTLQWWAWRLRSEERDSNAFVEVELGEAEVAADEDSGVMVRIDAGLEIRLSRSFDTETLRRVVTTLAGPC